jgi:hypothetical protein
LNPPIRRQRFDVVAEVKWASRAVTGENDGALGLGFDVRGHGALLEKGPPRTFCGSWMISIAVASD